LWENGGETYGAIFVAWPTRSGFPAFFHISVDPVISTRRGEKTELKKIGFIDFLNNYRKKKGKRNPIAAVVQIE